MTVTQLITKYEKRKAQVNKVVDYAEKIKAFHVAIELQNLLRLYTTLISDLELLSGKSKAKKTLDTSFDNHPQL